MKEKKEDKLVIEVNVSDLRKLRSAISRHEYYQTKEEKEQSFAALLGFIDGWISGLFSGNDL